MSSEDVSGVLSMWDEARGHFRKGEYDKASEICSRILATYGDDDDEVASADIYLREHVLTPYFLNLVEKHLQEAIRLAPGKAHYHYLLGFTHSTGKDWARAAREFGKAVALDPDNGEYERGLGWALFNGGDRVRGLAHLYGAVELSPANASALTDLATATMLLAVGIAREYGEKAVQVDPGNIVAQRLLEEIDYFERRV